MTKNAPEMITNLEYRKADGISSSDFRLLEISALHLNKKENFSLSGNSFDFGSALHKMVLESDDFDKEFAVAPDSPRNTKAGKDEHTQFFEELEDKTAITSSEYTQIKRMSENIQVIAGRLLQNGIAESSYFAKDENGIIRKCRPDYYIEKTGLVIDVKTTKDGSEYGFKKAIAEYSYHRQAAWYLDTLKLSGKKAERFAFITVEKTSPYMVRVYELEQEAIQRGREEYQKLLNDYTTFLETGKAQVIKTISLPEWAKPQTEIETY
jgi:hypothetical protein